MGDPRARSDRIAPHRAGSGRMPPVPGWRVAHEDGLLQEKVLRRCRPCARRSAGIRVASLRPRQVPCRALALSPIILPTTVEGIPMSSSKQCPECESTHLYVHGDISARGGYGPDLLPGTSGVFTNAKMKAIVCKDCGLVRFYAQRDTLAKLSSDKGWQRLM